VNGTERYPLDFAALERGSVISEDDLKRIFSVYPEKETTPEGMARAQRLLRFETLELVSNIERHFLDERGDRATVSGAGMNGGIKVLLASEQYDDSIRRQRAGVRKAISGVRRFLDNELLGLTEEQLAKHPAQACRMSWQLQQLTKTLPPRLTDGGDNSNV